MIRPIARAPAQSAAARSVAALAVLAVLVVVAPPARTDRAAAQGYPGPTGSFAAPTPYGANPFEPAPATPPSADFGAPYGSLPTAIMGEGGTPGLDGTGTPAAEGTPSAGGSLGDLASEHGAALGWLAALGLGLGVALAGWALGRRP